MSEEVLDCEGRSKVACLCHRTDFSKRKQAYPLIESVGQEVLALTTGRGLHGQPAHTGSYPVTVLPSESGKSLPSPEERATHTGLQPGGTVPSKVPASFLGPAIAHLASWLVSAGCYLTATNALSNAFALKDGVYNGLEALRQHDDEALGPKE